MDARPVLGMPAVRTAFLDDISSPRPAQTESRSGADDMTADEVWFDDVEDDDLDDDDDEFGDEDDGEDDDEEDENAEDPETWQVCGEAGFSLKAVGRSLDFRSATCLDWRPLPSSSELDPFGGLRVCLPAQSLGS
jgi:hypothetical protein